MNDPKIEPWMTAAAKELYEVDKWKSYHHFVWDGARPSEAEQKVVDGFAEIIARYAPDPASVPIGPGDVVQTPVGDTYIVAGLRPDNHVNVWFNRTLVHVSTEHLTRIGRAEYWPDGTKVEESK